MNAFTEIHARAQAARSKRLFAAKALIDSATSDITDQLHDLLEGMQEAVYGGMLAYGQRHMAALGLIHEDTEIVEADFDGTPYPSIEDIMAFAHETAAPLYHVYAIECGDGWLGESMALDALAASEEEAVALCEAAGYTVVREDAGGYYSKDPAEYAYEKYGYEPDGLGAICITIEPR